jgi:hypothetical protein
MSKKRLKLYKFEVLLEENEVLNFALSIVGDTNPDYQAFLETVGKVDRVAINKKVVTGVRDYLKIMESRVTEALKQAKRRT